MSDLKSIKVMKLEGKKKALTLTQMGIGTLGTVSGWVYANKTGGGFWRYVGFGLIGGVAIGAIGYFTLMQKINKIDIEIKEEKLKLGISIDE
tara:strand:- start:23 stop:298 length:276 start_codon:yes stop_codon:yes gene_type:complete